MTESNKTVEIMADQLRKKVLAWRKRGYSDNEISRALSRALFLVAADGYKL